MNTMHRGWVSLAVVLLVACGGGGGGSTSNSTTSPSTPPLNSGVHTLSVSLNQQVTNSFPVNGITFILQLPEGVTIATNAATDSASIANSSIAWGSAITAPQLLNGSFTASTRQVKMHMINTSIASWMGEFVKLKVTIAPGSNLFNSDFNNLAISPTLLKVIAVHSSSHSTLDVSNQSSLVTRLID